MTLCDIVEWGKFEKKNYCQLFMLSIEVKIHFFDRYFSGVFLVVVLVDFRFFFFDDLEEHEVLYSCMHQSCKASTCRHVYASI